MIEKLKQYHRWNTTLLLIVLSIICFLLSVFRHIFTDTRGFLFLNWNLFLAFLPWLFTTVYTIKPVLHEKKWIVAGLLGLWLLFFPNAPYILTDLFHLGQHTVMPVWFDLVLIVAFAWTGLLFGFVSLFDIETFLRSYFSGRTVIALVTFLLFLGSFGIYLGRYLRWNSWDIISEPLILFYDIENRLVNPLAHPRTWGMTFFMGLLLNMIYWSLKIIRSEK